MCPKWGPGSPNFGHMSRLTGVPSTLFEKTHTMLNADVIREGRRMLAKMMKKKRRQLKGKPLVLVYRALW